MIITLQSAPITLGPIITWHCHMSRDAPHRYGHTGCVTGPNIVRSWMGTVCENTGPIWPHYDPCMMPVWAVYRTHRLTIHALKLPWEGKYLHDVGLSHRSCVVLQEFCSKQQWNNLFRAWECTVARALVITVMYAISWYCVLYRTWHSQNIPHITNSGKWVLGCLWEVPF